MRRTKDISRTRRANLFSDMFNVARKLVAQITTDGDIRRSINKSQVLDWRSWAGCPILFASSRMF